MTVKIRKNDDLLGLASVDVVGSSGEKLGGDHIAETLTTISPDAPPTLAIRRVRPGATPRKEFNSSKPIPAFGTLGTGPSVPNPLTTMPATIGSATVSVTPWLACNVSPPASRTVQSITHEPPTVTFAVDPLPHVGVIAAGASTAMTIPSISFAPCMTRTVVVPERSAPTSNEPPAAVRTGTRRSAPCSSRSRNTV